MDVILVPLIRLFANAIGLYMWAVIIAVILSWLSAFNVINTQNRFVYSVINFVNRITQPPLHYIRRWMPDLGSFDVSPILLIMVLLAVQEGLFRLAFKIG